MAEGVDLFVLFFIPPLDLKFELGWDVHGQIAVYRFAIFDVDRKIDIVFQRIWLIKKEIREKTEFGSLFRFKSGEKAPQIV